MDELLHLVRQPLAPCLLVLLQRPDELRDENNGGAGSALSMQTAFPTPFILPSAFPPCPTDTTLNNADDYLDRCMIYVCVCVHVFI